MKDARIIPREKKLLQDQISVRDVSPDDVDALIQIQLDPLVVPNQYKTDEATLRTSMSDCLSGENDTDNVKFRQSAVLLGETVIGHVSHCHIDNSEAIEVYCGWNLHPKYWGNGLMGVALAKQFDAWFSDGKVSYVNAYCFRTNRRCIRVLKKLGFAPLSIPLDRRIMMAWRNRCLHWHKHFYLSAETWLANELYGRAIE